MESHGPASSNSNTAQNHCIASSREREKVKTTPGSGGSGGSGAGAKDGRRTWTDAESDRLREVMEQPGGKCFLVHTMAGVTDKVTIPDRV